MYSSLPTDESVYNVWRWSRFLCWAAVSLLVVPLTSSCRITVKHILWCLSGRHPRNRSHRPSRWWVCKVHELSTPPRIAIIDDCKGMRGVTIWIQVYNHQAFFISLLWRIVNSFYFQAPERQESRHGYCGSRWSWGAWTTCHCSEPLLCISALLIDVTFCQLFVWGNRLQRNCRSVLGIDRLCNPKLWQSVLLAIVTRQTFLAAFHAKKLETGGCPSHRWIQRVAVSDLQSASEIIRNDFLCTLWEIRNNAKAYAIKSVIVAGTFSILLFNPSETSILPFNVKRRNFCSKNLHKIMRLR